MRFSFDNAVGQRTVYDPSLRIARLSPRRALNFLREIVIFRDMKLELYHFESCPYCVKVRKFIEKNGLKSKITYYDTLKDEAANQRLMEMNDDDQVPCLVIDGKPMLESDDIIEWLKKQFQLK
jgi:glutaredoxin